MASSDTQAHGARAAWRHWLRHPRESVPAVAVVTVVVTAVLTTFMVTRAERQAEQAQSSPSQAAVAQAPQSRPPARPDAPGAATMRLGAGPACGNCGVIESVVMRAQHGGYRVRIRMDDGSERTVERRDALLAGSRVVLQGQAIRVLPGSPQG